MKVYTFFSKEWPKNNVVKNAFYNDLRGKNFQKCHICDKAFGIASNLQQNFSKKVSPQNFRASRKVTVVDTAGVGEDELGLRLRSPLIVQLNLINVFNEVPLKLNNLEDKDLYGGDK